MAILSGLPARATAGGRVTSLSAGVARPVARRRRGQRRPRGLHQDLTHGPFWCPDPEEHDMPVRPEHRPRTWRMGRRLLLQRVIERLQAAVTTSPPRSSRSARSKRMLPGSARSSGSSTALLSCWTSYGGQIMTALRRRRAQRLRAGLHRRLRSRPGRVLGLLLSHGPVTRRWLTWSLTARASPGAEDDFVNHFAAASTHKVRVRYAVQQPLTVCAFKRPWQHRPGSHSRPGTSSPPTTRPSPRRRTPVRRPDGRHHRRSPLESRDDGLYPDESRSPHRNRRRDTPRLYNRCGSVR